VRLEYRRRHGDFDPGDLRLCRPVFPAGPEPKQGKNRLHLDLSASGGREAPDDERRRKVDVEVELLVGEGAAVFKPGAVSPLGEYWVIMQDPEGNEFCVQ
jgi:Glyoxalase-like domain